MLLHSYRCRCRSNIERVSKEHGAGLRPHRQSGRIPKPDATTPNATRLQSRRAAEPQGRRARPKPRRGASRPARLLTKSDCSGKAPAQVPRKERLQSPIRPAGPPSSAPRASDPRKPGEYLTVRCANSGGESTRACISTGKKRGNGVHASRRSPRGLGSQKTQRGRSTSNVRIAGKVKHVLLPVELEARGERLQPVEGGERPEGAHGPLPRLPQLDAQVDEDVDKRCGLFAERGGGGAEQPCAIIVLARVALVLAQAGHEHTQPWAGALLARYSTAPCCARWHPAACQHRAVGDTA